MVQTLPGDFIDIQGDKKASADKKNPRLTFGQLFHRLSLQVHDPTIGKQ